MRGLPLAAASRGHSSLRCVGLSLSRPLFFRSTDSRRAGSVVVAHGPSCSAACGIFPNQGPNPCPLHLQADSQPLRHQGSPDKGFYIYISHLTTLGVGHCYPSKLLTSLRIQCQENAIMSSEELMFTLLNENQIYVISFFPACPGF